MKNKTGIMKKMNNNEYWKGCEVCALIPCWWECERVQCPRKFFGNATKVKHRIAVCL